MSTLLVVDDEATLTNLMRARLEPLGFKVHAQNCCKTAFQAAKQLRPDIVILDVMLGDGAGYQVSRQIRSDPELYLTPVLFMSTLGDAREVEYSFAQGGDQYLTKPFTLEELTAKLAMLKALAAAFQAKEPVTRMYSQERMGREVDFRLLRGTDFALAYVSVEHLDVYRAKRGVQEAARVIGGVADVIRSVIKHYGAYESFCSYSGNNHFMLLLRIEDYKRVCRGLPEAFSETLGQFYTELEREQGYQVASLKKGIYSGHPLMSLQVCVTHTRRGRYACMREMLGDVRAAHHKAAEETEEVVFSYKQGAKW